MDKFWCVYLLFQLVDVFLLREKKTRGSVTHKTTTKGGEHATHASAGSGISGGIVVNSFFNDDDLWLCLLSVNIFTREALWLAM